MKNYYFRYTVNDYRLSEFIRFRDASRYAKKLNEPVFLGIFVLGNPYSETVDEIIVRSPEEIRTARKKLITSFYEVIDLKPMSPVDYRIAYRFLRIRATKQSCFGFAPFNATINLPESQSRRIYKFLSYNHGVKFI
jgi:hypothetical protein